LRLGIIAAVTILASCSSNEKPALRGFDAIRAAVEVKIDAAGAAVMASSAPAARVLTEYDHTIIGGMDDSGLVTGPGGSTRSTRTVFVEARKAAGDSVTVDIVRVGEVRVAATAAGASPPAWEDGDGMRVGAGLRDVSWQPTVYVHECEPGRPYCLRRVIDRLTLSPEDVRAVLAEGSDEILLATRRGSYTEWRLDKNELIAVLDALGARERFR
jgi:hypothetical protein